MTCRIKPKADQEVLMERFVGVEDARGSLGQLVDEVAAGGDVVALTNAGNRWLSW